MPPFRSTSALPRPPAGVIEFPESGRPGRVPGTRELVIPGTFYVAAYTVTKTNVRILRVLHGAQIWPDEFTDT